MGHRRSASLATRCDGRRSTSSTRADHNPAGSRSPTPTGSTPAGPSSFPPPPHHLLRHRRPTAPTPPSEPARARPDRPRPPPRQRRRRPPPRLRRRIRRQPPARPRHRHLGPSMLANRSGFPRVRWSPARSLPGCSPPSPSVGSAAVTPTATGRPNRAATSTPVPLRPTLHHLAQTVQADDEADLATDPRDSAGVPGRRRRAPPRPGLARGRHPRRRRRHRRGHRPVRGGADRPGRRRRRPRPGRRPAGPGRPRRHRDPPHRRDWPTGSSPASLDDRSLRRCRQHRRHGAQSSRRSGSPAPDAWSRCRRPRRRHASVTTTPRTRCRSWSCSSTRCRPNRTDAGRPCSPTPPASASPSSSSATRRSPPARIDTRRQRDRHRRRRATAPPGSSTASALYRLRADEAAELLGAVNDANHEPDEDDPDSDRTPRLDHPAARRQRRPTDS